MSTFTWIDSPAWQLVFFGLPNRIPWPADAPAPSDQQPFEMELLLSGMKACISAEPGIIGPWRGFIAASEHFDPMTEALEDHEYARAAEELAEIEKHHPGSPYGLFHQAFVQRQSGNDQEAVRLYSEAAQKAPGIPFIWDNLGTMLAENGQRDQAVHAFIQAVQVNPQDQVALESLVQLKAAVKLLRDPKDPKSAMVVPIEQFQQMAEGQIEPLSKNPEQLVQFAEQLLRDGIATQAGVKALEKARELMPEQPRVLIALGAGYRMQGKFAESCEVIRRYTEIQPQDPWGYFNLAQSAKAAGDAAAERSALEATLKTDPNIQPALGIYFELRGDQADPAKEQQLVAFANEHNAWMPLLLASSLARDRGDIAQATAYAAKAFERNPNAEEVLLQYSAMLGDAGDAANIEIAIQPAVTSGRFSKRLDWNYAQSLRQLGKSAQAIEVLRRAQLSDAPDDFKAAAENAIELWTGLRAQCGIKLEVHPGSQLLRPLLLRLDEGEGGMILQPRQALPAHGKFQWRAREAGGTQARVQLQQGQSGIGKAPRLLGTFTVKNVKPAADGSPASIECRVQVIPDGTLTLTAGQDGRKLPVEWSSEPA